MANTLGFGGLCARGAPAWLPDNAAAAVAPLSMRSALSCGVACTASGALC